MAKKPSHSNKTRNAVYNALRSGNESATQIAERYGLVVWTVCRWANEINVELPRNLQARTRREYVRDTLTTDPNASVSQMAAHLDLRTDVVYGIMRRLGLGRKASEKQRAAIKQRDVKLKSKATILFSKMDEARRQGDKEKLQKLITSSAAEVLHAALETSRGENKTFRSATASPNLQHPRMG